VKITISIMKVFIVLAATIGMIFNSGASFATEPVKKRAASVARSTTAAGQQAKLLATRAMLIDRKKTLRDHLQNSMVLQEKKMIQQKADYEAKKELFDKNLITKVELENSERVLSNTRLETERIREWIAEDDRALALVEESAEAEANGFPKHTALVRYDGASSWSLTGMEKISRFFRERFGRMLPVSAMGQSSTHDRLGLDHRDAVDVALRPDSTEGRDLMAYLRRSGIPYIAFRSAISSMSTGAHIHIGRPSPRLSVVKHAPEHAAGPNQGDARS
jgi:hypothetical protein